MSKSWFFDLLLDENNHSNDFYVVTADVMLQKIRQISRQIFHRFLVGIVFRINEVTLVGDARFISFLKIFSAEKYKILNFFLPKNAKFSKCWAKPPQAGKDCSSPARISVLANYHFPLFRRLHSRQSIWQFSAMVLPPSRQGVMWSASICSISKCSPQMAQIPFCLS